MKIVHLSCYDINGGAGHAAWRVHESLRLAGAQSSMFVSVRESHAPDVQQYVPGPGPAARFKRIVRRNLLQRQLARASGRRPAGYEDFRDDRTVYGSETAACAPDADIYHLHQIADFVDYRASLARLAARAPIVWTLHEMTPFTGGCQDADGCDRFTRACGGCPQLGSTQSQDLSYGVWKRKRAVFQGIAPTRMRVVGANRWMAAEAQRSTLLRQFPVSVIPYGLDTDVFRPIPDARHLLDGFGIKPSTRIVLLVADWTSSRRKGFELLTSALDALPQEPETAVISLGRGVPDLQSTLSHVHLGSLNQDRLIAAVYSMADLLLVPSSQDDFPYTVLEAMACGTPVVGFRVGGIPDLVREDENSLLVSQGDVEALASAIHTLLVDDSRRVRMGRAGRDIAEREYSRTLQGERYLDLYGSLLAEQ
jgi:glycosyltransferase involved in cell wall biosynthesis